MKLKKLSLLAGAIALAFSITPLAANAQARPNAPQGAPQTRPPSPEELKLSKKQMSQINTILTNRSSQMQAVLSPQQRKKIQTDLQAGKNPQQVLGSIQFTKQQENQLRTIMVDSQKKIEALLTNEQKKKIQEWRAKQQQQQK